MRKSRTRKRGRIRKFFRVLILVLLGVFIGILGFEAIMLVRVLRLRTHNPGSTSLIEARIKEANARGQQARREQIWVSIDRISPNLQRAILAGEDTNFLTHRGFDYEAIQKVWDQAQREAAREAKAEGDEEGEEGEDQSPSGVHEGPAQRRAAGRPFVRAPGCPVLAHRRSLTRTAPPRARP